MSEKMNFQPEEEKRRHDVKMLDLNKIGSEFEGKESQDVEKLVKIQERAREEKAQSVVAEHQAQVLDLEEIRKAQKQAEIIAKADAAYGELREELVKDEENKTKKSWFKRLFS